ncbi:methionine aminotransferase [Saprospira sp. CCB-QB6]|uniref:methionine aminotransferase n=1 Tax=Saprospira sp. CCB-QB6 TaxID=3023936 RepID=UPI002349B0B5|nr:methionine aminotransferase [Saprospira sp. CCB-QB6]WCL80811.1 methionine aminotransferase [Saprospira sp. CCB-QB6]
MIQFQSKFPAAETTIFSVMSALAQKHQAINLSQGFPNYPTDRRLIDLVHKYMLADKNQYAPMAGVPELNQRLSQKMESLYGASYDPATEITITAGATEAIFSSIMAFVGLGDEVIIIEPAYDCYVPAIELAGAKAVPYALKAPNWAIDWVQLGQLITDKTRMLIINSPHNPIGRCFSAEDMQALSDLLAPTNIILLSDEVYEHIVFDGQKHLSALSYPALRDRTLATYSFGKTLHTTGWKLGYVVGAAPLMREFRMVHQFNVFSANTAVQYAIAEYLEDPSTYLELPAFFQAKRDLFLDLMKDTPFQFVPSGGSYFQLGDYSQISNLSDVDFARWLTIEKGVAVIPLSPFYSQEQPDNKVVRFCFAKTDETLAAAAQQLQKL